MLPLSCEKCSQLSTHTDLANLNVASFVHSKGRRIGVDFAVSGLNGGLE